MPGPAFLWSAADYLQAQLVSLLARTTAWSDRIYWSGYAPLAQGCLIIAAVAAVVICMLAYTDEKDSEVWSTVALAGRWMGGVAVAVFVLAAWTGGHGVG